MKLAICQVADTGPLESLVVMLRSVGYSCVLPDNQLKKMLRGVGCDTVLDVEGLVNNWGYEYPIPLESVGPKAMNEADLYVDIKGYRNGPKVWERWPRLKKHTLYYRINGGFPEVTPHGDEINLSCPILTPNRCYAKEGNWSHHCYSCWPPFYRFNDYSNERNPVDPPVCLIHNLEGWWSHMSSIEGIRELGVRMYGAASPDGLVRHTHIPEMLSKCLCMVHLKTSDAPGYSLYEALAAKCPVVVPERLIERNAMEELFEPNKTCLSIDWIENDRDPCISQVEECINVLKNLEENKRIGEAGYERLKNLMWSKDNPKDVQSLREFMERCFP